MACNFEINGIKKEKLCNRDPLIKKRGNHLSCIQEGKGGMKDNYCIS